MSKRQFRDAIGYDDFIVSLEEFINDNELTANDYCCVYHILRSSYLLPILKERHGNFGLKMFSGDLKANEKIRKSTKNDS